MFASRWHSPPKLGVGVELRHRHVQRGEAIRVEAALHVTFEDADADLAEGAASALEQGRLAGSRRTHQIDDRHAGTIEVVAIRACDRVVGVEHAFHDAHLDLVHRLTPCLGWTVSEPRGRGATSA